MTSFEDRLKNLAEIETRTIQTYRHALPHIDTPEFAARLSEIEKRHCRRLDDIIHYLPRDPNSPERALENKSKEKIAVIGDTAETVSAVEQIAEAERVAARAWNEARGWDDLPIAIRSQLEEDADQELRDLRDIESAFVSVKAAAELLGPRGQPPILHH